MSDGYALDLGAQPLRAFEGPGWCLDVTSEEASFGNGAAVSDTVQSLMRDGDASTTTRYGNRVAVFHVLVTASDQVGLAAGEAALEAELDRPNTLTWRTPFGPASVFEVVRSYSEFLLDDLDETRLRRTFRVTVECLPFVRSEDPVTFTWTGGSRQISLDKARYTVVGGGATLVNGTLAGGGDVTTTLAFTATNTKVLTTTPDVPLRGFLLFKLSNADNSDVTAVSVGGVALTPVRTDNFGGAFGKNYIYDVSRWRGQTPLIQFTLLAGTTGSGFFLSRIYTMAYPAAMSSSDFFPRGIDVVDVLGTARAPVTISFAAPAGGAFVYTAPDPVYALQTLGVPELEFSHFTVAAAGGQTITVGSTSMWFPQGTWSAQIGRNDTLPPQLGRVFPFFAWGVGLWSYPSDTMAAVTFYDTTGAKNLISPSPSLQQGYHGGAVVHESHVLHPGRCGFAVLDQNNKPITTTVTYYPRWKHHAGL